MRLAVWLLLAGVCAAQSLDQYGGDNSQSCTNTTEHFITVKVAGAWRFCTPAGHVYFYQAVYNTDGVLTSVVNAKYGGLNAALWGAPTVQRLKGWGFNALGPYSNINIKPVRNTTQPMPFIGQFRSTYYGEISGSGAFKDIILGTDSHYTNYRGGGFPDVYDPQFASYLAAQIPSQASTQGWDSPYTIGINIDDTDETQGFGCGPDFDCSGHTNPHLGHVTLITAPSQTSGHGSTYSDAKVYSKYALVNFLCGKGTGCTPLKEIDSVACSRSSSTVTCTVGAGHKFAAYENISTSGCSDSTFNTTAGTGVMVSAITSTTVAFTLTGVGSTATGCAVFAGPNYGTVTALNSAWGSSYNSSWTYSGGFGTGNGILDENGRNSWVCEDDGLLSGCSTAVKTDLNNWQFEIARFYFQTVHDGVKSAFPDILYLGPSAIGTWSIPAYANILRSTVGLLDILPTEWKGDQDQLDWDVQYAGDLPIVSWLGFTANPKSKYYATAHTGDLATQELRGQAYYDAIYGALNTVSSVSGVKPYAGFQYWGYVDMNSEDANWGLVSLLDNAYDGHEDVAGSVACSAPISSYTCGGEGANPPYPTPYGDMMTCGGTANCGVVAANALWLGGAPPVPGGNDGGTGGCEVTGVFTGGLCR